MPEKVVFVIVDGMRHDTALSVCGFLEGLVAGGKARRFTLRAALPSISLPLYETLHTGLPPVEHGFTSNELLAPSRSPNVFGIAREHGLKTAACAHYYFSVLYNGERYDPLRDLEYEDPARPIPIGRFHSERGKTRFNIAYPGDGDLLTQAGIVLKKHAPDYLLVHSCTVDAIGHAFGATSAEYRQQCAVIDNELAQNVPLWQALGYRVIVTADHGQTDDGWHGGPSDAETLVPWYDIGHPEPGIAPGIENQLRAAPTLLSLLGLPIPRSMREPPLPV
ncbi:alkaline phosphatase family protein [Benzoatithermus flavus]|uniref:Alkaline phosphatase family protein n=1 Tax=Benzoatithermus flavus TaxID=3108223 RepID=A0ABU8XSW4_9PROT